MHKNIITELLNWFDDLFCATWKTSHDIVDALEKERHINEANDIIRRKIRIKTEIDFWSWNY